MRDANINDNQQLFMRIAEGDEIAFRQVFDYYNGKVSRFIFVLIKSEQTATELVQDIFVNLWIQRDKLARVDHHEAYLFRMAANRTMDYLRKRSTEHKFLSQLWKQISNHETSAEDHFIAKESQELINRAVVQLSHQKQKIFRLSRYEGLNHEEIAHHLHVSKSTVKNHLVETLRHIRSYLHHHSETLILFFSLATEWFLK